MAERGIILAGLFCGFWLLFWRIRWLERMRQLMRQTKEIVDEAARQRMLEDRRKLLNIESKESLWLLIERQLQYSGLNRRLPFLTAERWIAFNLIGGSALGGIVLVFLPRWWLALGIPFMVVGMELLYITIAKARAMRKVEQNLLKFLDFLGNYSITAGEVTGIFNQVSRYMEEPLKSVLDECYYEAQTTGDISMALLSMAEKIEHPQFKELVRNIEISSRYSADFTMLVQSSRRTIREYLRSVGERKNMLREAMVNMLLLAALSGVILITVDSLIEISIWYILLFTLPGRVAVGVLVIIFLLFVRQMYRANR